ncbi:hypothetical protein [Mycolicibacterium goodii]|uniref:hypothetical protein n=1 Tax=Mycolicibacterium goodii TaxID=134601 RepID=UPI0010549FDE|nr:hypothetical protein [Mycolicibacterium goodii]
MSEDLGVDFVNHPEMAATPEYTFKPAEWDWRSRNGNAVADGGDINDITLMVNGGYHGLAERTEYYNRGLQMSRLPRTHVAVLYIGCLARGAITACATPPQNTGAPETLTPVPLSTSLPDKSCRPICG